VHRYESAGFEMHPARRFWGQVRRGALPAVTGVRTGSIDDIDLLDAIDRVARGFGRGSDHAIMLAQFPLLIFEEGSSRGYAYHLPNGAPYLVAGVDERAAGMALCGALLAGPGDAPVDIGDVTSDQTWVAGIAEAVGLESVPYGYVGVRGMPAPHAYLPSGHFL
jgi:hypothetical protein